MSSAGLILDAYAGPGGWSEGLRSIGLADTGVELDAPACATRAAALHRTIRADVATFPLNHLAGQVDGLIMSPPCQAFSTAGTGTGRDVLPELADAIRAGDWAWSHDDDRVRHVLEVGRWAETLLPRWIVCEQVPPVLHLWHTYAARWRAFGWMTWAGVLNAADYGVPQTRRRAFLIARTDGRPAIPPTPTHRQGGALTLNGELRPWVTMGDALGWDNCWDNCDPTPVGLVEIQENGARRHVDEPAMTISASADNGNYRWVHHRPATTLVGDGRAFGPHSGSAGEPQSSNSLRLTLRDALILQGFPADYPVRGTKTKQFEQVGNAVPPPLAAAVVAAVAGVPVGQAAA